jgi:signal transduction histidine kinase
MSTPAEPSAAEHLVERAARRVQSVCDAAIALASATSSAQILAVVLEQSAAALDAPIGEALRVEGDACVRVARLGDVSPRDERLALEARSLVVSCAREGAPLFVSSREELADRLPDVTGIDATEHAWVLVPLAIDQRVVAMVRLAFRTPRGFDTEDHAAVDALASQASLALGRLEALAAERVARAQAERAVQRVLSVQYATTALQEAVTPEQVARSIVGQAARAMGANDCLLYRVDGGSRAELVASSASPKPVSHSVALEGDELVAEVIRTQRAAWALPGELGAGTSGLFDAHAACFAVPLVAKARVVGAMVMGFREAPERGEHERAFAEMFAAQCAQALDRAELFTGMRTLAERLQMLVHAGNRLSASLDYDTTLDEVAGLAMPSLADFGFFDLVETDGQVRRIARAHGDPDKEALLAGTRWVRPDPSSGIDACAIAASRSVLHTHVDDAWLRAVATDAEQLDVLRRMAFHSMMSVPLEIHGRVIGALTLFYGRSGRRHGPDDVALAEELARRAAVAIDSARLYAAAQAANRAKDEFLSVVSHELRTPLSAIVGWSRVLSTAARDPQMLERGLASITRNANAQVRIIEDILDVSRIVTGKLRLELSPLDVEHVVQSAVDVLRPTADAKRLTLEIACDDGASVRGDPERIQQVVWNLVNNAIKFTPSGGRVRVRVARDDASVSIVVRDDGAGIHPDFLPFVFDRFRQADSSSARAHGGLGRGLAIVRHIVELHGGTVKVESDGPGRGATFTATIPAHADAGAESVSARHEPPRIDGMKVLLVDDESDARDVVCALLEQIGGRVLPASSTEDALSVVGAFQPDVIVSDIGMPGADGYAFLARLRARGVDLARMPAVALTAYTGPAHRDRALQAGFAAHLPKPVDAATLGAVLSALRSPS